MNVDVLVVGAGHAGIEAALAACRMNARVCLVTSNVDHIGYMSCNPAIGGLGKSHIVKEIDALGGQMATAIDNTGIQFRRLNKSKGPAVWACRVQADKMLYSRRMKQILESTKMLHVKQSMIHGLLITNKTCVGAITTFGEEICARATILCPGTFLNGIIHIGTYKEPAGRGGDCACNSITDHLRSLGFTMGRLKTGTVPRLDRKSIDFSCLEQQPGDDPTPKFSFFQPRTLLPQVSCYVTYTNSKTHEVIQQNLHESALYSGRIQGTGPRYCPSIEDKVVKFSHKSQHQVFLEPEGLETQEIYPNGLSNSLCLSIQKTFLRTIKGLEHVEIVRPGYAIEYDYVDPLELYPWLETKKIQRLFHAGQINGTTGYEEAAGQGIMAGINAVLSLHQKEPFVLKRSESYMGVLIDDIVTKGVTEPYRMFTSRAEHRLHLREDNADQRIMPYAQKLGLLDPDVEKAFMTKIQCIHLVQQKLVQQEITPTDNTNQILVSHNLSPIKKSTTLMDLLRRPQVTWNTLLCFDPTLKEVPYEVAEQIEISIKYEGYISREQKQIEKSQKNETEIIPKDFDFLTLPSLSHEVREKLIKHQPQTLGQASRISGITPAAVGIISIFVKKQRWCA